jgi:predicted oxidoreductase
MIRIDFGGSGTSTPRRIFTIEAPDFVTDIFNRKDDSPKATEQLTSRAREEVRRLEIKVARVAAQKSSVEEVSSLHQELLAWLSADAKQENQASFFLFLRCSISQIFPELCSST